MNVKKRIQKNIRENKKETVRWREWRRGHAIQRIERPTNISRAKSVGYKAKKGVVLARVRIRKGGRKRPKPAGGRKPKKAGRFFTTRHSLQSVAEKRVNRKYPNLEVVNSYKVGQDGQFKYFEVIMVDRDHPSIKNDKKYKNLKGKRAFRGKTSASKKSRGL